MASVMLVVLSASACGHSSEGVSSGTSDCTWQIKSEGAVFSSYGFTSRSGGEYGTASMAGCEDNGEGARGSVFTSEGRSVTTHRIADYPPSRVLGVWNRRADGYAVFVADSVGNEVRDRIYRRLD